MNSPPSEIVSFGPFRLSPTARAIERDGIPFALGDRALDILIVLVERAGGIVSHRELISRVWRGLVVSPGNLRVHMTGLRKALSDGERATRYIANVSGQGYCFVAPIRRERSPQPVKRAPFSPSSAGSHRRALPPVLARMVGRDDAVRIIAADLVAERFVTIVGPGGMGKTTVAVSVAHAMREAFSGAVCFVDLGASKDPKLVTSTVASTIGLAVHTDDALPTLMAFLRTTRMLLVLDNCEHVIDVAAELAELIFSEAPGVHILATSREALRVEGEHAYWLSPLEGPPPDSSMAAADVLKFAAVKLFVERATASGSRFELSEADAPIVAGICGRLDGIALAIEFAAGRVGTHGIEGTARLLEKGLGLHWQGRRTALPRHQTLRALLDWSYGLLPESEQLVLQRLAIFVGTFTLEAAKAVASGNGLQEARVAETIDHLVAKSLLSAATPDDGETRYRLLETTRVFALERLRGSGELEAIAQRHAGYFAMLLHLTSGGRLEPCLEPRTPALPEHLGNVRSALEWCFMDRPAADPPQAILGVDLAAASAPAFLDFSLMNECHKWTASALALLDDTMRGGKRELVLQEAVAISSTWVRGDTGEVLAAIRRGLELAQSLGETAHQLRLLTGLHIYLIRIGDMRGSLAVAEELHAVARTTGDVSCMVMSDWLQGSSQHFLGDQAVARQYFQNGFARGGARNAQQFGLDYRVRALVTYARVLWLCGRPDRAREMCREAIGEAEHSERPLNVCLSLLYTSPLFLMCGDLGAAQEIIERAARHPNWQALTTLHAEAVAVKGGLLIGHGDNAGGTELLRSVSGAMRANGHVLVSLAACWLAEGLLAIGRLDEALEVIDGAIAESRGSEEVLELPELLRIKAVLLLAKAGFSASESEDCLMRSIACARRQSAMAWELRTTMTLAQLRASQGHHEEAHQLLSSLYAQFTEGFDTGDLKAAKQLLNELDQATRSHSLSGPRADLGIDRPHVPADR